MIFAQAAIVAHWAIILIVIAGIVGIAYVVFRQAGIAIPGFVVTIFWILLACILGILAVKFLVGQAGI